MGKNKPIYTYTCLIYEDSVKPGYIHTLKEWAKKTKVSWVALSPWHDKDINKHGELKKKHRHVVVKYRNNTSYDLFKEECEEIQGVVAPCMIVGNKAQSESIVIDDDQMLAYLLHKDRDNLFDDSIVKYDIKDLEVFGKLTKKRIENIIAKNEVEDIDILDERERLIQIFVDREEFNIRNITKWCYENNPIWWRIMANTKHCNYVLTQIRSAEYANKFNCEKEIKIEVESDMPPGLDDNENYYRYLYYQEKEKFRRYKNAVKNGIL